MTAPQDDPFSYPLDEFLTGPGYGWNYLDIDPVFATPLDRLLHENQSDEIAFDEMSISWPSKIEPDLHYVEVEAGVLLVDRSETIVGAYIWTALALDPAWQDKGLGAELVEERVRLSGNNPVWHLDKPAYSPAGIAAHHRAWQNVRRQRETT